MAYNREDALVNLETALGTIATPTYENDVVTVSRDLVRWDELNSTDMPALFIVAGPESTEGWPGRKYRNSFVVGIVGYLTRIDGTDLSTAIESLIGDVKKAAHVDVTRGGIAILTRTTAARVAAGLNDPEGIFELDLVILYDSTFTSP